MKKIYYFPGLISALLIPVLFGITVAKELMSYTVMDLGLPAKLKENSLNTFEPYRKWNYKKLL
jgi:hypothetical protein